MKKLVFICCLFISFVAFSALMPGLTGRVVDEGRLLTSDQKQQLEAFLTQDKKNKVVVVVTGSLKGQPLSSYANELYAYWDMDSQYANQGILMVLQPSSRQVYVKVAPALRTIITDPLLSVVMKQDLLPYMTRPDYLTFVANTAQSLTNIVKSDENRKELARLQAEAEAKAAAEAERKAAAKAAKASQGKGKTGGLFKWILFGIALPFMLVFIFGLTNILVIVVEHFSGRKLEKWHDLKARLKRAKENARLMTKR